MIEQALAVLIVLWPLAALAQDSVIVSLDDGTEVKLNPDKTWEVVDGNNEPNVLKEIKYAEEAVEVWNTRFDLAEEEYKKRVRLFIDYLNKTNEKVIGVKLNYKIVNPFGKVVLERTIEDETLIKPNERLKNGAYYAFDDNPFINDEPFDQLWQMAQNGTAKINMKVLKVVFADGTVLESNPGKAKMRSKK